MIYFDLLTIPLVHQHDTMISTTNNHLNGFALSRLEVLNIAS